MSYVKFNGYKIYNNIHPQNSPIWGWAIITNENILNYKGIGNKREEVQVTSVNLNEDDRFIFGDAYNAENESWGSRLIATKCILDNE